MKTTREGEPSPRAGGARWSIFDFVAMGWQAPAQKTYDELMAGLKSGQPVRAVLHNTAARWVLASTAAGVLCCIGVVMLASRAGAPEPLPEPLIATGAGETSSVQLPDGGVLSLEGDSAVSVSVTHQHSVSVLKGAVTFEIPDLIPPFLVETPLALVRVLGAAKFHVEVSARYADFEVYEGTLWIYQRGAKPGAAAIRLDKGQRHRLSAEALAGLMVERRSCEREDLGVRGRGGGCV